MILDDPHDCPECGTRRVDVLPSRGDCQTCLAARLAALKWLDDPVLKARALSVPLEGVLLVRSRPTAQDTPVNDRHGWHCPCVACRIDRGED